LGIITFGLNFLYSQGIIREIASLIICIYKNFPKGRKVIARIGKGFKENGLGLPFFYKKGLGNLNQALDWRITQPIGEGRVLA